MSKDCGSGIKGPIASGGNAGNVSKPTEIMIKESRVIFNKVHEWLLPFRQKVSNVKVFRFVMPKFHAYGEKCSACVITNAQGYYQYIHCRAQAKELHAWNIPECS